MDKQHGERGLEEGLEVKINGDLLRMTLKNIKLKSTRPRWNIWILVEKIHPHS